jgi:amino acid adenylation domain-containing protein
LQIESTELSNEPLVLPASFAQQRMWFLDRLEGGGAAYNVPTVTRLRGPLDVDALGRALTAVVERHESLRTVFTLIDGVPHQLIKPPSPVDLEVIDVSAHPDAEERALELVAADGRQGFDLGRDRLLRVTLIRLGDQDHVLSLTIHHIVTDGWSVGVINRELATIYGALVEGRPVELPALALQYADYAVWQQQWMESGGLDQQLEYWTTKLAGAPTLLELPTDRPRPSEQSFRGATLRTVLPSELLERLRALSEREGSTLFMTLLSAFAVMLARYSGQDDVVVATPVANRSRVELEQLIGLLVNTLAIRVDMAPDPSFVELLRGVRETALEAFSNQDLPFERLVQELNPDRNRSHAPVAQVLFVLQNAAERPIHFSGLEHERVSTDRGTAKFDLALFAGEVPAGLRVSIEYCSDLFSEATIQRMLRHFETLLEAILADPARPVSELDLLPAEERELVLDRWSGEGETEIPAPRLVHELVADQARRTPDAIAVAHADQRLSYADLDAQADRLGSHLRELGVGPDTVVAICAERSVEMVVAVLGVLKAGGAYAPIDPAYPAERIRFMLADSDAPVLLTQQHLLSGLPDREALTVCLDSDWESTVSSGDAPRPAAPTPDNLAYVLYTSGSTGQPKGVAMPHRPLANLLAWQLESTAPGPVRTLQFASLSFDVAFQEIFSTWCSGGTLVLADEEVRRDPEGLLRLLAQERVERLFLPFVALQNLCEAAEHSEQSVADLREIITAGEQLKVTPAVRRFFSRHKRCTLFNHYGPTESHVVTALRLSGEAEEWPSLPPIGRPISGAIVRLLDRHLQPVPIGVPGELCIGGVSLARGYLGQPELTAERFVEDPLSSESGARMYRTGDLARHLPDGNIEFLGRIDHQVKVRGYRIEPGEIEAALRDHDSVREALVLTRDDDRSGAGLVAYLRVDEPGPTAAELHEFLLRTLPTYMVPAAFVTLAEYPLSPNGKVDRRALPAPDDSARMTAEYAPPADDTEGALADVWAELLGLDRVGRHDNFFALGGHSLLAVRVVSRVRDRLGVELALSAIFDSPTIAGLAAVLDGAGSLLTAVSLPPILPSPREARRMAGSEDERVVLPASYAEQRLWFLDRLEPDNPAYNVPMAVRLAGSLDVPALRRALDELVARHESLRTTFAVIDGAPHQVVAPPGPVTLAVSDLQGTPDAEQAAQRVVGAEAARGFDLSSGPLLRAALIRLAADDQILIITLHHIIVDGWSIGVFQRELSALYGAFRRGEAPELPRLAIQYGDFAAWQQEWLRSGGLDQQLEYWREQLAGAPALLELPTDRPRPARQTFRGAVVREVLGKAELAQVKQLGEGEGTTLFMTLLAAFVGFLSRYSGQEDVVVASPVANRNRAELEGLIGFFVNTLPLRASLEDDPSFRQLLHDVRQTAVGAFSNQDLPFEKLVEELNPDRQLSFPPLAQVSFALNTVEEPLGLEELRTARVSGARRTTKFDLGLYAAETAEGLRLSIEYSTDLFDEATVERMLAHYMSLLRSALEDPGRRVSELPLLDEEERELALAAGATAQEDYPVACMHELFERAAAERPQTIAATHDGAAISYEELNRRANQVAHCLRSRGAGPGTLIALLLEPSLEMLAAILGVLKAGAAYVPLDPEYPAERLSFVLEDTGAPIVVLQSSVRDRLPASQAQVLCLDQEGDALAQQSPENPEPLARPEDLAYVIYTSGSTGRPKGVQVEHRQVARLFSATEAWYGFGPSDVWMLLHSYAFDFSVWELWGALAHGGRLVITPRLTTRTPAVLAALITDQQVTVLNATPSLFLGVQEALLQRSERLALREVIFGGEALEPPALRPWFARFGDSGPELVNMYGITETTVHVTYRPLVAADCERAASPIGEPIPDLSLYLLDRHREPVPRGVVGELFVGGAGVARGYLNRSELTAERFIENPFGSGRLYRTGDVARRLPGGELDFRGRMDDQVKIRGFRIELGEIRAALGTNPAVNEATVIASPAQSGDVRLAAYIVAVDGVHPPGADELRSFLAERLPSFMIPAAWVFIEALPLTRNGKLDVKALPAPEFSRAAAAQEFAPPTTATELALAPLWSEALGVERIGVQDSFFELGGHSLLAVRLFSEIERKLGVRLPLSALFETDTIAGLADLIERDRREKIDWGSVVRLREGGQGTPLFLVAWAGGEVLPYRDLAQSLEVDLPVYGLQAPGVDHRASPLGSVDALARHYVAEVRRVQPHGPYRLGGFCFSGLVAYEMARLLMADGEEVSLLALLDAYPWQPRKRRRRIQAERAQLQTFRSADRQARRQWLRTRVRGLQNRLIELVYIRVGPRVFEVLSARGLHGRLPRRPWNLVLIASNLARIRYVPRPLDVRVEFFRAQTDTEKRPTPWDSVAGHGVNLRQIIAPGIQHERMMHEPYVGLLAAELTRALEG